MMIKLAALVSTTDTRFPWRFLDSVWRTVLGIFCSMGRRCSWRESISFNLREAIGERSTSLIDGTFCAFAIQTQLVKVIKWKIYQSTRNSTCSSFSWNETEKQRNRKKSNWKKFWAHTKAKFEHWFTNSTKQQIWFGHKWTPKQHWWTVRCLLKRKSRSSKNQLIIII